MVIDGVGFNIVENTHHFLGQPDVFIRANGLDRPDTELTCRIRVSVEIYSTRRWVNFRLPLPEVWSINQELLEECRNKSDSADIDDYTAVSVIIEEIWRKLKAFYRLRVV